MDLSKLHFTLSRPTIKLNPTNLADLRYESEEGYGAFSLQHYLIHELFHGADKSLTPQKELAQKKAALRGSIHIVLEHYPELRQEYQKDGTLMGRPVGALFNEKDLDTFLNRYDNDVLKGFRRSGSMSLIKGMRDRYPSDKDLGVLGILNIAQENLFASLMIKQDEQPVINQTNPIIRKYYGELRRNGYKTISVDAPASDFKKPMPQSMPLAPYTHPDILNSDLASTRRCPKNPVSCGDRHMNGVNYAGPLATPHFLVK